MKNKKTRKEKAYIFLNKQHLDEILKKIKQMLRNTLRLKSYYLKIIHILHPRDHPKIIGK